MRIVGEDRLAGHVREPEITHSFEAPLGRVRSARRLIVEVVERWRDRVAELRQRGDRIAGLRAGDEPSDFVGPELLSDLGAQRRLIVRHDEPEQLERDNRIGGLPGLGTKASQQELGRQSVFVRFEEGVDAVGVGLKALLRRGGLRGDARLRVPIDAERAQVLVELRRSPARRSPPCAPGRRVGLPPFERVARSRADSRERAPRRRGWRRRCGAWRSRRAKTRTSAESPGSSSAPK